MRNALKHTSDAQNNENKQDIQEAIYNSDEAARNYNGMLNTSYLADQVFEKLDLKPASTILIVGCGDGQNIKHLLTHPKYTNKHKGNLTITGFDFSQNMINLAKQHLKEFKNITLLPLDATKIAQTFKKNEFDEAASVSVLHWIPDQNSVLEGLSTVVKGKISLEFAHRSPIEVTNTITQVLKSNKIEIGTDPWVQTSKEKWLEILEKNNLRPNCKIEQVERHQKLNKGYEIKDWIQQFMRKSLLKNVSNDNLNNILDQIQDNLKNKFYNTIEAPNAWAVKYYRLSVTTQRDKHITNENMPDRILNNLQMEKASLINKKGAKKPLLK